MFLKWRHILCIVVCIQLCNYTAVAQSVVDTSSSKKNLQEAIIKGRQNKSGDTKVNDFSPGQKLTVIDSTTLLQYRMQSIANLLVQQVPVFIKSYSFNGLATLNFRGSSAAQSQVLWNGVPIQNAALGIADVSTLPVMFMTRVNVLYGGAAALYGSGNVGGILLLENGDAIFGKGTALSLSGSAGSFKQYAGGGDIQFSFRKWYVSVKSLLQSSANDFNYIDNNGKSLQQANSQLKSNASILHIAYKSGVHSVVGLSAWMQQYDREIPPALYERQSVKKQIDGSLRLLLDWNKKQEQNNWYAKSSFIKDDIKYDDDALLLHTSATAYQYYQEIGWKKNWGKEGQLLLFVPIQVSWMKAMQNSSIKQQDRKAIAGAYNIKLLKNRLSLAANARIEAVDSVGVWSGNAQHFFLPGINGAFAITSWLMLRANMQRTYRVPTLNELYYFPGGNTSLKPEQGWNQDAGYTIDFKIGNWTLYHDLAAFNRNIQDWIIWLGGAIWTPHNIAEVHSRGVETENRFVYTINKWKLHAGLNTAYVLATTVKSYAYNDGSIGKQIPYTPRYNGQLNVGFTYKRLYFNYNHTYTGYRYTVADESAYLLPYNTGNVQLSYGALLLQHNLQLTAQFNNIWDAHYNIVFSRPMPGVNYFMGLKINLL